MPLQTLIGALPALYKTLNDLPAVNNRDVLWDMLRRLLVANAPSGGANLLGGIGDDIAVLADELGLRDQVKSYLGSTGNTGIWLGADKTDLDIVVVAHMDRPSFRVRSITDGALYPICANRFPEGDYRTSAKAVRFERGRLVVVAAGMLVSHKNAGQETLTFETKRGQLAWQDIVLLDASPVRNDDTVIGAGLDNSLGVLIALLAAAVLHGVEDVLRERGRRCLFVFTDQEEGPPDGFFGHGAARLAYTLPPPAYGCVIVDGHATGPDLSPQPGRGASHAAVSGWGRGSVVPPNYHALAVDLADKLNAMRPGTVQMNTGHLSRSDDMALCRWTRILGLTGTPLSDAHTGHESARLSDVQSGVWWLSHFLAAALNLSPVLTPRYALGR